MKQRRQKKLSRSLFEAVQAGDARTVKALLHSGACPERGNGDGTTPLYLASVQGEAEIARLLLEAGASPDTESAGPGSEGTPLCAASCWGHTETVRQLLAYGADPNLREDHGTGRTPLEWADGGPHPATAAILRVTGASRFHELGCPVGDGLIEECL
ncbi:ankyrin repeat domain-containing protein [Streptomyces sp. NPDC048179]|uniref:ankyrin repeat domain-containing protein n=1 Tax=Streptomyces sp. NPDC048179 TaxID=3365506 RepID=UPI00371D38DC